MEKLYLTKGEVDSLKKNSSIKIIPNDKSIAIVIVVTETYHSNIHGLPEAEKYKHSQKIPRSL